MSKLKEIKTADIYFGNCLLGSMNEKLYWVAPEKKEAVQTVMFAMAEEIFAAFNIVPSLELVKLTKDKQLISFKLLSTHSNRRGLYPFDTIQCQGLHVSLQSLKEKIMAAGIRKEILTLLIEDPETLVPIVADLIKIIDHFLAEQEKQTIIHFWEDKLAILPDEKTPTIKSEYWKQKHLTPELISQIFFSYDSYKTHKNNISHEALYSDHKLLKSTPEKHHLITYTHFFKLNQNKINYAAEFNQHQILDEFARQQHIDLFNHRYEDFLDNLKRLLRRNLTIVRFLLVLVDNDGNRLMPLTQQNLVAVCTAITNHETDLQNNTGRLERLFYLCSQSKKFSCEVINWMRMYEHHCASNESAISFPELLLTYCANFPEHVDDTGPLPLRTLCAKFIRDKIPRHQVPYAVALELIDEENVLPNGIGDDQNVVALLSALVSQPSQVAHLQLGM